MAEKKRPIYFWLKFDNNFYKNLAIKKARRLAGGDTMVVIYQKLMLASLDTSGVIYYEGEFGSLTEELSLLIDEEAEQVSMTMAFFQKSGLIQIDDNDNVEMLQVPALLDQETNWARYKREQRKKDNLDNVQLMSNDRPTELDIDIDIEKEIDTEIDTELDIDLNKSPANEMLNYFNTKMNRDVKNTGIFGSLVLKNVSVQEFKDVVNYVASWSEDILQNVTANTIAKKFDNYSDKAAELGFRDGNEPKKKRPGGKPEKVTPKFLDQQQAPSKEIIEQEELPEWMQDV